jgi:lipopolysaccharide cholinephosphotransferase
MKKNISSEELKKMELDVLDYIIKRCEALNIKYFLSGGTLIGAIRHQGYIPWDDDIDINMLREDYDILLDDLRKQNDNYELLTCIDKKGYRSLTTKLSDKRTQLEESDKTLGKIQISGVCVDIFPVDGLGKDENIAHQHLNKILRYRKLFDIGNCPYKASTLKKTILRTPIWLMCKILGYKFFYKKIQKLGIMYSVKDSEYVACATSGAYKQREFMPREIYDQAIANPFEKRQCLVPIKYHTYLTIIYNDYMQLPPVEERKAPHELKAWWK